jgi:hypothetical protein
LRFNLPQPGVSIIRAAPHWMPCAPYDALLSFVSVLSLFSSAEP